jgi:hypothetical protein
MKKKKKGLESKMRSGEKIPFMHGQLSDFVVVLIRDIQAVVMGIQTHSKWTIHFCIRANTILKSIIGSSKLSLDLLNK